MTQPGYINHVTKTYIDMATKEMSIAKNRDKTIIEIFPGMTLKPDFLVRFTGLATRLLF